MTPEKFNQVWLPLSERLRPVALQIMKRSEDADDALQDLYVKLWRNRDKLDRIEAPAAYATTLLRNLCIDKCRSNRLRSPLPLETAGEDAQDCENRIEQANALARAEAAIGQLPFTQREIIRLRILEDLSFEDVADLMGHSPLYIRVQLSMARKKLKKIIDGIL